ncbi:hypothetical protein C8Q80DRAFT_626819 [Daedaleopsis nitida]|nr:hypothetical protein C8Q80DRAFT_626819 [Daedaleopsis nitida]
MSESMTLPVVFLSLSVVHVAIVDGVWSHSLLIPPILALSPTASISSLPFCPCVPFPPRVHSRSPTYVVSCCLRGQPCCDELSQCICTIRDQSIRRRLRYTSLELMIPCTRAAQECSVFYRYYLLSL